MWRDSSGQDKAAWEGYPVGTADSLPGSRAQGETTAGRWQYTHGWEDEKWRRMPCAFRNLAEDDCVEKLILF